MRKRWKWLVAGLVVLLLGAFLFVPGESDGLEAFRRLGPISEESSSLPAPRGLIVAPTDYGLWGSDDYYTKKFTYGRLSDAKLASLRKVYTEHSAQLYHGTAVRWLNLGSTSRFTNEQSVVTMSFIKEPTQWDRLWAKVKAFFGRE